MIRNGVTIATLCALVSAASVPAIAGLRIESKYFPGPNLEINGRWLMTNPRAGSDPAQANTYIAQSVYTELQLAIPPAYIGKNVSIHVFLPGLVTGVDSPSGLLVEWRTQGVFLSGQLRPGERVLLYRGLVGSNMLSDRVAYTFRVDARYATGPIRFEPEYEISEP